MTCLVTQLISTVAGVTDATLISKYNVNNRFNQCLISGYHN